MGLGNMQRSAVRWLAVFLCVVIGFTVLSRMADSVTVARVKTDTVKSGFLTHRVTLRGVFEPVRELEVTASWDLRVVEGFVKTGQTVAAGDELLAVDLDEVTEKLEQLKNEQAIRMIKLDLAESGFVGNDDGAVADARFKLERAKTDYEKLLVALERERLRADEDLADAQTAVDEAEADFTHIYGKTRDELIKAAREKVDAAREASETTRAAADEAIKGAKYAYELALAQNKAAVKAAENDLADAKERLEKAKRSYDKAVENHGKQGDAYYNAQNALYYAQTRLNGALERLANLEKEGAGADVIAPAQAEVTAAERAVEGAQAKVNSFDLDDKSAVDEAKEIVDATQKAYDRAKAALADAQKPSLDIERAEDVLNDTVDKQNRAVEKAEVALLKAENELAEIEGNEDFSEEDAIAAAQKSLEQAQRALTAALRKFEDGIVAADERRASAERAVEDANRQLEEAQKQNTANARDNERSRKQNEAEMLGLLAEIKTADKTIGLLTELATNGGKVLSPVDGVVLAIAENGAIARNTLLCKLSLSDAGFGFSAKIDEDDAKYIAVGDKGFLTYADRGNTKRIETAITSISPPDENGEVEVISRLPAAAYPVKASGEWVISKQSEKQNACLPLSALHSDELGEYVLAVRDSKSVLGNEQTVARVAVSVISRDSQKMSIEGAFMRDDLVVTFSNKPIAEGDRVFVQGS